MAGVGARRAPPPAHRPQPPRVRPVRRGPPGGGRRPVPAHRPARHPCPLVLPAPRPLARLPHRPGPRPAGDGLSAAPRTRVLTKP
ncbi:Exonuclease SbcC [Streptomyces misionensis JCM 4497]